MTETTKIRNQDRLPVVLLIEDDPGDQELVKVAMEAAKIACRLFIVDNGETALDYLFQRNQFANEEDAPLPDLVLLDLNMPGMGGIEVMQQLSTQRSPMQMTVIVLTTSDAREDIHTMYQLGVKSYITKPDSFEGYIRLLETIGAYWLHKVLLPSSTSLPSAWDNGCNISHWKL